MAIDSDITNNGAGAEKLTRDDVVEFAHHLQGLAGAGVALAPGLRALGEETKPGPVKRTLLQVADQLDAGESLDEVLRAQGHRFPPHLRGMVLSGLRSGRLADVLGRFIGYERVGDDLRRRVWLSLAYPTILMTGMLGVFIFISWVVRDFERIYKEFGIDLPGMTIALIRASNVVTSAGWTLLLIPVGVFVVAWLAGAGFLRSAKTRRIANGWPLLGALWRWSALAEYAHLLALLLECEIPLPEALPTAAEGVADPDLIEVSRRMARDVEAGASLADTASRRRVFPSGFARLMHWAEHHRSLPEALHMIGETYEARARAQVSFVGIFALVTSVVLVVCGILFVVLGLYLPLILLIRKLSF